ncbi:hypothetical protein [Ornithinibacillus xuwenensis]|uniref:Uncharacterized protein n=1 Tax=Ornithinibacillus xuwenensis TaxID=3144668 RepID=A0ABU9XG54_9BACI
MKSCLQLCSNLELYKDIESKLKRDLTNEEMDFLQWVFNRYLEEKEQQSA